MPAAILQRGAGAVLLEQPVEIRHVVEAGAVTDLVDGLVGTQQQFAGMADPHVQQEFGETLGRVFLEKMAERRAAHIDQGGHVADLDMVVGKVLQDVAVHQLDAVAVRFKGLRREAFTGQESGFRRLRQQVEQLHELDDAGEALVFGERDHFFHGRLEGLPVKFDAPARILQQFPDFVKTLLLKKMPVEQAQGKLDRDHAVRFARALHRFVAVPFMVEIGTEQHQIEIGVVLRGIADDPRARDARHEIELKFRVVMNRVVEAVIKGIQHHANVRFLEGSDLPVNIHF